MLKSRLFDKKRLDITIDRLCHQLIENHSNFKDSYNDAREFILSGKAHEHLKSLQNV